MVRWFESQGDSANASAGIVGNLEQESQLNPAQAGGGLAQWTPAWYGQMVAYAASVGLSPTSDQGQLAYLQYDLRTSYSSLLSSMDTAPDPGTAAEMFETTYEQCQGVVGYMDVIPGSLCEDANRKRYAVIALAQAGGSSTTTVPVSLAVLGGGCAQAAGFGSGKDPIPSPPWVQERDDMGVDASAPVGSPIYAPAASTLVEIVPWFEGPCGMQPFMLFHFTRAAGRDRGRRPVLVRRGADHPGDGDDRHDVRPAATGGALRRVRNRDRDRLGIADLRSRDVGRADGGRGSREPRGRLAHPVGREFQAVVSDARLVDRHLTLTRPTR